MLSCYSLGRKNCSLWNKFWTGINCFNSIKDFQAATIFRARGVINCSHKNLSEKRHTSKRDPALPGITRQRDPALPGIHTKIVFFSLPSAVVSRCEYFSKSIGLQLSDCAPQITSQSGGKEALSRVSEKDSSIV